MMKRQRKEKKKEEQIEMHLNILGDRVVSVLVESTLAGDFGRRGGPRDKSEADPLECNLSSASESEEEDDEEEGWGEEDIEGRAYGVKQGNDGGWKHKKPTKAIFFSKNKAQQLNQNRMDKVSVC